MGSKPLEAGVIRALRFCVIESSIALREVRKKSARSESLVSERAIKAGIMDCNVATCLAV